MEMAKRCFFVWFATLVLTSTAYAGFVDNGDGTVTDTSTGLMWEVKTDDGGDRDAANSCTWEEALEYCESLGLANHSDWRLPDKEELRSIADYENYDPSIDDAYFPNTQADGYWSSTTCAYSKASAWYLDFNYGGDGYGTKTGVRYVRAVRGGQHGGFVDIGDGTLLDASTGLMWEIKTDDGG